MTKAGEEAIRKMVERIRPLIQKCPVQKDSGLEWFDTSQAGLMDDIRAMKFWGHLKVHPKLPWLVRLK